MASSDFTQLPDLIVHIEQVVFMPNISTSIEKPYGFVYFLSIENKTPHTVQLMARKWIVREEGAVTLVVEGEGIVGEKPRIEPGDSFSYNSCHIIGANAVAEGAFFGVIEEDGRKIRTAIPQFKLSIP